MMQPMYSPPVSPTDNIPPLPPLPCITPWKIDTPQGLLHSILRHFVSVADCVLGIKMLQFAFICYLVYFVCIDIKKCRKSTLKHNHHKKWGDSRQCILWLMRDYIGKKLENFNLVEIIINIDIVNTVYNIAILNLTWPGSSPKSPLPSPSLYNYFYVFQCNFDSHFQFFASCQSQRY